MFCLLSLFSFEFASINGNVRVIRRPREFGILPNREDNDERNAGANACAAARVHYQSGD
jgi:hypothetical protein